MLRYTTLYVNPSIAHLDLIHAPYVLYGVKYIDLVSLAATSSTIGALDLGKSQYRTLT